MINGNKITKAFVCLMTVGILMSVVITPAFSNFGAGVSATRAFQAEGVNSNSQVTHDPILTSGKSIWIHQIWNISESVSGIINKLNSAGVKWLTVKLGDSNSYWPGHDPDVGNLSGWLRDKFGVWNEEKSKLLDKKPPSSQTLIKVIKPPVLSAEIVSYISGPGPQISGVEPDKPIAVSGKQWITINGKRFSSNSQVIFATDSETYPIPSERTWFINSNKIEVLAGLPNPSVTWEIWVKQNGFSSNKVSIQTRKPTPEDYKEVAKLALHYWGKEKGGKEKAITMVAIAAAESNLNPKVGGDHRTSSNYFSCAGYISWGLWQINMHAHKEMLKNLGAPIDNPVKTAKWLSEPSNNVKAAYEVWKERKGFNPPGFNAWSTYKNGTYKKYLDEARKAVSGLGVEIAAVGKSSFKTIIDDLDELVANGKITRYDYYNETNIKQLWDNLDQYKILLIDEDCMFGWDNPGPDYNKPTPVLSIGVSFYNHKTKLKNWIFGGVDSFLQTRMIYQVRYLYLGLTQRQVIFCGLGYRMNCK